MKTMTFAPENIDTDTWPAIHAVLAPALAHADTPAPELIDLLLANMAQLWVLRKGGDPIAAAVTELRPSPRGVVVHGMLLAGENMDDWIDDALACVKRHARDVGAIGIEIIGRDGWERLLTRKGWKRSAVTMRLELEGSA
jgi:hypothetical protein